MPFIIVFKSGVCAKELKHVIILALPFLFFISFERLWSNAVHCSHGAGACQQIWPQNIYERVQACNTYDKLQHAYYMLHASTSTATTTTAILMAIATNTASYY